jgi:hypothetical protein
MLKSHDGRPKQDDCQFSIIDHSVGGGTIKSGLARMMLDTLPTALTTEGVPISPDIGTAVRRQNDEICNDHDLCYTLASLMIEANG